MRVRKALLFVGVAMLAAACAATTAAPPSVNVSGNGAGAWSYENPAVGQGDLRGTFQQDGDKVSGRFDVTGPVLNRSAIISGSINGLNVARVTLEKQRGNV